MSKLARVWLWILAWAWAGTACADAALPAEVLDAAGPRQDGLANLHQPALGAGVDFAETRTFRRCVTMPMKTTQHGFAERLYDEYAVRSRRELNERMNISADVSAKGFFGDASAAFNYFKNVEMSEDGFYWLVDAHYALLDTGLDTGSPDFRLTDDAIKILNGPGGLSAFYEACGHYFYSGSQTGARYSLLYEFRSNESHTMEEIRSKAAYSGFGVTAKAEFAKFSELAERASVLRVHAANEGGDIDLRPYATRPELLELELQKLSAALYNQGQGVALKWFIQAYDGFAEVQIAKQAALDVGGAVREHVAPRLKTDALVDYYDAYQNNVSKIQRIQTLVASSTQADPLMYFSGDRLQKLHVEAAALLSMNRRIQHQARSCLYGSADDCVVDADVTYALHNRHLDPSLATPDKDFTTLMGWRIFIDPAKTEAMETGLAGFSPVGAFARFFTGHDLWLASGTIFTHLRSVERPFSADFHLGTSDMVRDPVSGQFRVNLCVYQRASTCSLRLIETGASHLEDVMNVKLQLVLFDEFGFVLEKKDFPLES